MQQPPSSFQRFMPMLVVGAVVMAIGVWWGAGLSAVSGKAVGSADGAAGGCNAPMEETVLDAKDEEELVDAVYARMMDLATPDSGMNFELGEIDTHSSDDFETLLWGDVATVSNGVQLGITRHVAFGLNGEPEVEYKPKWLDTDIQYEAWEGKSLGDWTVAEALERAAVSVPDAAEVTHISTFRVDVFAYGKSRIYRAAFLWLGEGGEDGWRFKIVDNITQGLSEVAEENIDRFIDPEALNAKAAAMGGDEICATDSEVLDQRAHAKVTTQGYREGETLSEAQMSATCSCLDTCVSVCKVRVEDTFCGHNGAGDVPAGWSMSFMATIVTRDGVGLGEDNASECGASYGCIRTQCPYGVCPTGVRITTVDGQLQFAQDGEDVWSAKDQVQATCPPCGQEGLFQTQAPSNDEYEEEMNDQEDFD